MPREPLTQRKDDPPPRPGRTGHQPGQRPRRTAGLPDGLQAGLKNRHLSMIAIGGVIGAGLFVGSGAGIAAAGPGILLSYALVGLHGRAS